MMGKDPIEVISKFDKDKNFLISAEEMSQMLSRYLLFPVN